MSGELPGGEGRRSHSGAALLDRWTLVLPALTFLMVVSLPAPQAKAGVLSSILRGAERSSERAVCRSVTRSAIDRSLERDAAKNAERGAAHSVLTRDAERDATTAVERLPADRTVFRYTTREQADKELRDGVEVGRHTTANASPGRPLTSENAQRQFGLPQEPDLRLTLRLPKGTRVKANNVVGGAPGTGELRLAEPVPASAITNEVSLGRGGQ